MNNLAYSTQDPEKVGDKVEELLRKELGATNPIPFQVQNGEAGNITLSKALGDAVHVLFGGKVIVLFTLQFQLSTPRPFQLQAHAIRQGIGCHIGALLYDTILSKPVDGEIVLEDPKTFGTAKFKGESTALGRLNANNDLLKRANKFARVTSDVAGISTKMPRYFHLVPQDGATALIVNTLPRSTSMGMGASMDAKEFCDLAALLESNL